MAQDIVFKVKSSIYGNGRGWCFTPNDFVGFADVETIRTTLWRLQKSAFIRQVSRGLYDYPRVHSKAGVLPPDIDQVAKAIARRDSIKTIASGAYAANLLGLSDQVPAKVVFLTDGAARKIKAGNTDIIFRKTTPKNMATAGTPVALIIQALRYMGQRHVDETTIKRLQRRIPKKDWPLIRKGAKFAPAWIRRILFEITGEKKDG